MKRLILTTAILGLLLAPAAEADNNIRVSPGELHEGSIVTFHGSGWHKGSSYRKAPKGAIGAWRGVEARYGPWCHTPPTNPQGVPYACPAVGYGARIKVDRRGRFTWQLKLGSCVELCPIATGDGPVTFTQRVGKREVKRTVPFVFVTLTPSRAG